MPKRSRSDCRPDTPPSSHVAKQQPRDFNTVAATQQAFVGHGNTARHNSNHANTNIVAPAKAEDLPSAIDLSKELSKLSLVITQNDAMETLENIQAWSLTQDPNYLKSFHTYAGIPRLLDYLTQDKTGNLDNVTMVAEVIKDSVFFYDDEDDENHTAAVVGKGKSKSTRAIASDIAKSFIQLDGPLVLIEASRNCSLDDLTSIDMVWLSICNVLLHKEAMLATTPELVWSLLQNATNAMAVLVPHGTHESVPPIMRSLFITMSSLMKHPNVTVKEIKARNVLEHPLSFVKSFDGRWPQFEKLAADVLTFFGTCSDEKFLSSATSYKTLLPLCLQSFEAFPSNDKIRNWGLDLLRNACAKIATSVLLKADVDVAVARILQQTPCVDDETKQQARAVMQAIFKG